jgi:predicted transcriptional regulator
MYKANLSWMVLQSYIKSLEEQGLVVVTLSSGKRCYRLSEKGAKLLNQFASLKENLKLNDEQTTSEAPW